MHDLDALNVLFGDAVQVSDGRLTVTRPEALATPKMDELAKTAVFGEPEAKEADAGLKAIDKSGAIEVLQKRIKNLSAQDAAKLYDRLVGPGGLNKRAALNTKGVETVLKLRSVYGALAKQESPSKYIDLSYYEKALAKK